MQGGGGDKTGEEVTAHVQPCTNDVPLVTTRAHYERSLFALECATSQSVPTLPNRASYFIFSLT